MRLGLLRLKFIVLLLISLLVVSIAECRLDLGEAKSFRCSVVAAAAAEWGEVALEVPDRIAFEDDMVFMRHSEVDEENVDDDETPVCGAVVDCGAAVAADEDDDEATRISELSRCRLRSQLS